MACSTPNTKCCVRRKESEPTDPQSAYQIPNYSSADITKSDDSNVFNASEYQNDPFLCPGHCVLNSLQSKCESPAVIIPNTSNCEDDTICCDDTNVPVTATPKPTKRPRPRPTHATTTQATFWSATTDSRKECPGLCIANLIRFTCYGNAEITDLFKCKRPTTICCTSKELVHETLAQLYFNQPIPPHGHEPFLSHSYDTLQKYEEPDSNESNDSELNEGGVYSCPGVCVANHFAGYCEAYLSSNDLCEPGSRCCVSRENSVKPVSDTRIIPKKGHTNHTLPVANPVQLISMIISSDRSTSTVKPIKSTVIAVETESKEDSSSNSGESSPSQLLIQSSTKDSSTESSNTKLLPDTAANTAEAESNENSTSKTVESKTFQSTGDTTQSPTEFSSTESTSIVAETELNQESEKPILNGV
ncbi:protein masquerade-like [Sitodiplosis mosellana]|uniref:protein masquerade-like n=1 Tax=Sitodiplosis mosellana TaxID=263140 RepID=UPI002443B306|nr:protein masquerade-like [Sitodiplosis mosellana]